MKKETLRFKGLLYLLTFVLLFGCKSKIDDYTKSLPDQAIFVVSVDVKNIVLKGGLSNFENPHIHQHAIFVFIINWIHD